ncbi:MAG: hypothetical protein Q7R33_04785 [Nitrosarchaeum sp.]|nr:hypothetical protein [Nitrosarchaeum sp.]
MLLNSLNKYEAAKLLEEGVIVDHLGAGINCQRPLTTEEKQQLKKIVEKNHGNLSK